MGGTKPRFNHSLPAIGGRLRDQYEQNAIVGGQFVRPALGYSMGAWLSRQRNFQACLQNRADDLCFRQRGPSARINEQFDNWRHVVVLSLSHFITGGSGSASRLPSSALLSMRWLVFWMLDDTHLKN